MANVTFTLYALLIIIVGGIFLQIFLSKRKSKWPGLILPVICLLYSILIILGLVAYNGMSTMDTLIMILFTFLMSNIPTIILLGIYLGCREKNKIHSELDKMNRQDLK